MAQTVTPNENPTQQPITPPTTAPSEASSTPPCGADHGPRTAARKPKRFKPYPGRRGVVQEMLRTHFPETAQRRAAHNSGGPAYRRAKGRSQSDQRDPTKDRTATLAIGMTHRPLRAERKAPKERFSGAVAVSVTMVIRGGPSDNDFPLPTAVIAMGYEPHLVTSHAQSRGRPTRERHPHELAGPAGLGTSL